MSESEVRVANSPTLLLETRACLSFKTSGSSVRVRTRTSAFRDLGRVAYIPVSLDPSSPCSSLQAQKNNNVTSDLCQGLPIGPNGIFILSLKLVTRLLIGYLSFSFLSPEPTFPCMSRSRVSGMGKSPRPCIDASSDTLLA